MALTGSPFRESCKDAIFWLIAIGVIPGDGVYRLNVGPADGTLRAGGRTKSRAHDFRMDAVWGVSKLLPA